MFRNPRECALEIVQIILDLVSVVVKVEHHAMLLAERLELPKQLSLRIELFRRFAGLLPPLDRADRRAEGATAQFSQARDSQLRILQNRLVLGAIPHRAAERHANDRQSTLMREVPDVLDGVRRA